MHTVARVMFLALAAGVAAYLLRIRGRLNRWGATDAEGAGTLPGDSIVLDPDLQSTRAVTIQAAAGEVFPWLAQIGQGRGGFYSYDWLENNPIQRLGIHSADRILPEFQELRPGDEIPVAPGPPFYGFRVADVEAPHRLVLEMRMHPFSGAPQGADVEGPTLHATWAFTLEPADSSSTRLVTRTRASLRLPVGLRLAYGLVLEVAMFVMERGMLLGIRARAERSRSSMAAGSWAAPPSVATVFPQPELAEASSR